MTLSEKLDLVCRIAKSYFDRGMGSGTTGNLSFMHEGKIYLTGSGTCFGFLKPEDFSVVTLNEDQSTVYESGPKPSKELPLHVMVYEKLLAKGYEEGAVIHTHSTYSVLWSCIEGLDPNDCVPSHTPYLAMKLGTVGLISYEQPGSRELFDAFKSESGDKLGWLLAHHGLIVGGKDLMGAFGASEELEESCKVAWELKKAGVDQG